MTFLSTTKRVISAAYISPSNRRTMVPMSHKISIVVLGSKADTQLSRVILRLEQFDDILVHFVDFRDVGRFGLNVDQLGADSLRIQGVKIEPPVLVWDAARVLCGTELYPYGNDSTSGFLAIEWRAFFKLVGGMYGNAVVNSLNSRSCVLKPFQQILAAQVGFLVPKSIVSNKKRALSEFHTSNSGKSVLKSLSGARVTSAGEGEFIPHVVTTMALTAGAIEEKADESFRTCPHFVQRQIEKAHELRVVIVGNQVLAYKINSQADESTKVDWRRNMAKLRYERIELDTSELHKLHSFMRLAGLFSGSLDLIVDPKGSLWFLECNHDGHWLWLDDVDNGAVTNAFANELHVLAKTRSSNGGVVKTT
jgi:hypothetical protein